MRFKEKAEKLKSDIPTVFIAMKKKETPLAAKLMAGLTVAYALSPIDLIPDFIPILGYLDDVLLLPVLIALTVKMIPPKVLEECRKECGKMWKGGKPKKWYYALPIAAVWLILVWLGIKMLRT